MKLQPLEGVEQAFTVPLDGDLKAVAEVLGLGLSRITPHLCLSPEKIAVQHEKQKKMSQ